MTRDAVLQAIHAAGARIEWLYARHGETDDGALDGLRAVEREMLALVVPVIPVGTEVIVCVDPENDRYAGGVIDSVPDPIKGSYRLRMEDGSHIDSVPGEDFDIIGPFKTGTWDSLDVVDLAYVNQHNSGNGYSKAHFLSLMSGDEQSARRLFDACDGQAPETLIDELGRDFFIRGHVLKTWRAPV